MSDGRDAVPSPASGKQAIRGNIATILKQIEELEDKIGNYDGNAAMLQQELNLYVDALKDLHQNASVQLVEGPLGEPVELPKEVVYYVDEGGNPDDFMKQVMTTMLSVSQARKGKICAIKELKNVIEKSYNE